MPKPSEFLTDLRYFIDGEKDAQYFASRYDPYQFVFLAGALMADTVNGSTPESQDEFWKRMAETKGAEDLTALIRAAQQNDPQLVLTFLSTLNRFELAALMGEVCLIIRASRDKVGLDNPEQLAKDDALYEELLAKKNGTTESAPESA
jgi:hypothetical protein